MKVKLDENMPRQAEVLLRDHGHDADTVHNERQAGKPDVELARAALSAGRMLMTLDRGFAAPATLPGGHPGVIVIRPHTQNVAAVITAVSALLDRRDLEDLHGSIVIVEPGRIRVRRST
ncbi:MAG TPA: DUF5615 family PIN-like protein [Chloroflexota bacterium]|nr:DUF5615 family PIN-like protein [Chloroflexota bacterium]